MFCEDEKENLFEQLAQQDRALETLQKDIAEYQKIKKEYLESIIQMQSKGRFLTKKQEQRPELIQIEIEALEESIKSKENDAKSLDLEMAKNHQGGPDLDDHSNVVAPQDSNIIREEMSNLKSLQLVIETMTDEEAKLQEINTSLHMELNDLKTKASNLNKEIFNITTSNNNNNTDGGDKNDDGYVKKSSDQRRPVEVFDVDHLIQESLYLKSKMNCELQKKKLAQTDTKNCKTSVRQSNLRHVTTVESLNRPLLFLRQHKSMSSQCQGYLRKLILALLETLVIKEKLVKTMLERNFTVTSRFVELAGGPLSGQEIDKLKENKRNKIPPLTKNPNDNPVV